MKWQGPCKDGSVDGDWVITAMSNRMEANTSKNKGFPGALVVKNLPANAGDIIEAGESLG